MTQHSTFYTPLAVMYTLGEMQVRVRLFAGLAEALGRREVEMEVPQGATLAQLYRELCAAFPPLAAYAERLLFAVNADYALPDRHLKEGDEVALIPPVSGG